MILRMVVVVASLPWLLFSGWTVADQRVEAAPGKRLAIVISSDEPTLFSVEERRIRKVWGGAGKVAVTADVDTGTVLLRPQGEWRKKPFSLFIKDDQGDIHTLVLSPRNVPAGRVILVPEHAPSRSVPVMREAVAWEQGQPYERSLVALVRHMATGTVPPGYRIVDVGRTVRLWKEVGLTLHVRYLGGRLGGEIYRLVNRSSSTMRLDEREFYRPGVLAVAIDQMVLAPEEETSLYLVTIAEEVENE